MSLDHEIDKASRRLPVGYEIHIEIEHAGHAVNVFDPSGSFLDFDGSGDLAEQVFEATEAAITHYESA